jgi:hypothetical protein
VERIAQKFSNEPRPFPDRDTQWGSTTPPGILYRIFHKESQEIQDKDLGKLKGTDWEIVKPLKSQIL